MRQNKNVSDSDTKNGEQHAVAKSPQKPKTKEKKPRIETLIAEAVERKIDEVGRRLILEGKKAQKNWTKMTMKRLYSYPLLKQNVERYLLDIEDIKKEDMGKSKSIVEFYTHSGGGEKPDLEELRAAKIRLVEMKINRDRSEIAEIEAALANIKDDPYYPIIELKFFEKRGQEDIAEVLHYSTATISRQLGRLMDIVNIGLYGADALVK
ncbi:MAG: hypothetical protein IJ849_12150 [Selenomonadaceae bacterium]|nr:hypothetical protein [Selenomonadaceae bacterium]